MFHSALRVSLLLLGSLFTFTPSEGTSQQVEHVLQPKSDEEAFLIRRIAEFWKDGDFAIVKMQIVDFLDHYPNSSLKDYFLGILGDIYLQENDYDHALSTYQLLQEPSIVEKAILNKLQCYYALDLYSDLTREGRASLSSNSTTIQERKEEIHFLLGEALFRQALQSEDPQEKKNLARKAQEYYSTLAKQEYGEVALFAQAEIHAILEEYSEGAAVYRSLADKHPHLEEELLFQVGCLEANYSRDQAKKTFQQIKQMEGKHSTEAAYNLLTLLFQGEEYEEVIQVFAPIAATIPKKYLPTFHFILGKSYFSVGQYQTAAYALQKYIDSTYIPSSQLKNALLVQMTCAHHIGDETLFSDSFDRLDSLFPGDQEIPKALFMHAMMLKKQGLISKADEKLQMIKKNYREFESQEPFLLEYAFLAHQNERWQEAYSSLKTYLANFSESPRIEAAWKLFLSSSVNLYKHSSDSSYLKPEFFSDLQAVFAHSSCLNSDEKKEYSLLYAKTAYELKHYSEALHVLQEYIFFLPSIEEDPLTLSEAHFIAGLCLGETKADHSALCLHLESAISLHPELYDNSQTHLQLYNAYISLAGYTDEGFLPDSGLQQKEFIESATKHLEQASSRQGAKIKEENCLWLADQYYQQVETHCNGYWREEKPFHPTISYAVERGAAHYQSLLLPEKQLVEITAENLYLEAEVIKLSRLLTCQNKHEEKRVLITNLLEQQSQSKELNWSYQNEALFELAEAYSALGNREKAFETYNFIHNSAGEFSTPIANRASLEAARIHFDLLEEDLKVETNCEVLSILNDLKELQIRKNAACEPTHLEAALEYTRVRALLSGEAERDNRYLFFLKRMKEDFTEKEDPVTRDYLAHINKDPSTKVIFDTYMKFIEAEQARTEAKKFHQQESLREMEELNENALALYNEIRNNPEAPRGLQSRVDQSVEQINTLNAY